MFWTMPGIYEIGALQAKGKVGGGLRATGETIFKVRKATREDG